MLSSQTDFGGDLSSAVLEEPTEKISRNSRFRSRRNSDVCVSLSHADMQQASFFHGRSPAFISTVMDFFQLETFMKGDLIMQEGDVGDKLLFLHRGQVDILIGPKMLKVATLGHGSIFGEMALLGAPKRTATIRAIEFCDCRSLDKHTFQRLLRKFPDEKLAFELMAKKRMEELSQVKDKDEASCVRRRSLLPPRIEQDHIKEQARKQQSQNKHSILARRPSSSRSSSLSRSHAASPPLPAVSVSSRTSTEHSLPSIADISIDNYTETGEKEQIRRTDVDSAYLGGASRRIAPWLQGAGRSTSKCSGTQPLISASMLAKLMSASPREVKYPAVHSARMTHLSNDPTSTPSNEAPTYQTELSSYKFLLYDHMAPHDFTWNMPDVNFTILCTN